MNLGNIRTLCRFTIPEAKINRISNANLDIIINSITNEINSKLRFLHEDSKFDVTAEKYKYDLSNSSETIERFLKIDKMGLWWNAGTSSSSDWRRLYPRTIKWLDKNFPQWRDADSDDPLYYAKNGKYLLIYPTPDTTLSDGFWLYHIENTRDMSSNSHYPFGHDSEIPEYSFLTNTIIKGVEARLKPGVGKKGEGLTAQQEYIMLIKDAKLILNESMDIENDDKAKIKIPHVC